VKTNLSPSYLHVRDARQVNVQVWQLLAQIAQATQPVHVRHVQAKPAGYNVTAYDSQLHVLFRAHAPAGLAATLKAIATKNRNVCILGSTEFVKQDRQSVGQAQRLGCGYDYTEYENPGLTD
jgi:hypothetical protein